ncbi:MAG: tetratricopeptide repeat protein [Gammaproteobacteria bacterium]|nr:tetratricopeptide repeat protein [Gammaproteobacteria bacterium]
MKVIRYFCISLLLGFGLQACGIAPNQSGDVKPGVETGHTTDTDMPGTESSEQLIQEGELPPADDLVDELQTDVPAHLLYKLLVAEIAGQRGELNVAIENYTDVARETHDPKVAARATQIALYAKEYDKALEVANLWVTVDPDNADARQNLASIYLQLARPIDAVAQYEKMLTLLHDEQNPGHGFTIIASQLAREPDRELAMSVMDKLVENRQKDPYALFAQAHLAMRQARFETALDTLDKALEIKPDWAGAIILRSRILAMQGARAEALSYLEKVLEDEMKDNMDVGLTYARMLTEARQLDKALVEFIRLAELDEHDVEINYYAGVLALQLNKLDEAQKYLEKVLKLGGRVQETNYYLGQVAEQRGDQQAAMNRYSFVRHGEFYFNAQLRIVSLLADKKDFDAAIEHLQTVRVDNSKQRLQLILLEGDLLREAERYPAAKDYYTKVLDTMPNETSVRYARALVAEKLGELDLVESDLQSILKLEPANAQVLNALGYTLADRTTRYEEALTYIQRALELEPDDAAVVDSMGWVQYRLGNYQNAIQHLRRAAELSQDPEIAAHLGEVLWVSGDKKGAREIWEKSLKENPDDKALMDIMKRFGM